MMIILNITLYLTSGVVRFMRRRGLCMKFKLSFLKLSCIHIYINNTFIRGGKGKGGGEVKYPNPPGYATVPNQY